MVKVRSDVVRLADGRIDLDVWVGDLTARYRKLDGDAVRAACARVRALAPRGDAHLENGIELAELVSGLRLDTASVVAALVYRPVRTGDLSVAVVREALGGDAAHLVEEVVRMAHTSLLEMTNTRLQTSERRDQVENVRRMLVAMIDDARVAVLKLAERVVALRSAKHGSEARRLRIAKEAHLVFAPLANRLGIWQVKWELEDLALRYLAPDIYRAIASQLDGRRAERERQVAEIARWLEGKLAEHGVEALVTGRAKHIYSIWRKMQSKNVGLADVHDQRAVRVLVSNIAECYAVLGVIHTQWRHIPSEFDDYIAFPKENGYRSIHTAVLGPEAKTLEVQIRTREMHEEAELGVCAHWSYKHNEAEDRPFSQKMNWLRQVVEAHGDSDSDREEAIDARKFGEELRQLFRDERIFVYTPKGHVLDLHAGSTPIDFAYRVHTEVGHRCRGALVEGRKVPLNTPLLTGQRVEIVTDPQAGPERCWLDTHLGYVRTSRAREKVHEFFRNRDPLRNEREGRARLVDLLGRLNTPQGDLPSWRDVARHLGFRDDRALFRAVGAGDCQVLDVIDVLFPGGDQEAPPTLLASSGSVPQRVYRLEVHANDRQGLLRDVTQLLSDLGVSLLANTGRLDDAQVHALLTLDIRCAGPREVAAIIDRLCHVPGVIRAESIDF